VSRPAVVVALPPSESGIVCAELTSAGFDVIPVAQPRDLEKVLDKRRDVALAILDGEIDLDTAVAFDIVLQDADR
jgi:hypothetical protein